ncbi:sigma 54-interacting transcriptional regulator [Polyangium jinanense]|uniref:Sigma 54-dependent Fis family transcriptional regulator n=1 Tax=Polyangium jinanense TaxID=2829994 RepID=A0A9X3WYI7_9BACT|nr:sigma 54-interacting transcriptional regulator [Polyangium jinanense]MDC3952813.1 sigma 54-dependent Fis family transcriptional regulator [Polyangium jinanense]MDC3980432.1 sigma 54-dependent Fis family transcriptional regulator [Polyangium jinanense]
MSKEPHAKETVALVVRPRECAIGRFRLQVTAGPDRGVERVSDGAELSVGTAAGNHLVLTDGAVSRHHCVITVTDRGFLVRDLGSRNGTRVSGFRVEGAYLGAGAVLGVGKSTLRFDPLPDEIVEPLADEERYGRILGQSMAMRRLFAALPRISTSDSTVLIEGETGTGKGLLAEVIHQKSARAQGPFVVIDCSSIPPTLIEAELFGYMRGAFTTALQSRAGAFEAAAGGTVFLDELGELPLDMQPKLLRALEERVVRRIGSLDPIKLDVRVIAATNRDLRQEVNRGTFRSDLYYRLNIVRIRLPPLRERREDIPPLVAHFYEQFARSGDPLPPAELVAAFTKQDWPGNVRELRAAVERAILMEDQELWFEATLGAPPGSTPKAAAPATTDYEDDIALGSFRAAKERAVARWERGYIETLVRQSGGNLSRAARSAHMDRNHLRELLRRHGISATEE